VLCRCVTFCQFLSVIVIVFVSRSLFLFAGVADTRYDILQTSSSSSKVAGTSTHVRHQSCPALPNSSTSTVFPSKSNTTPLFPPPLPPFAVPSIPSTSLASHEQQTDEESSPGNSLERQPSGESVHTIHYAELADISEEPVYENTVIIAGEISLLQYSQNPILHHCLFIAVCGGM